MPRFDGMGPRGMGPMTGRGMGPCGGGYGYGRGGCCPCCGWFSRKLTEKDKKEYLESEVEALKEELKMAEGELEKYKK
jgi:hypothetical protein